MTYFLDLKENLLAAFYKRFTMLCTPFTRKKGAIFAFYATTISKSNGYKLKKYARK